MDTKYKKPTYLVLTTEVEHIIAVLKCKSGVQFIKQRIETAIKEYMTANDVLLVDSYTIEDYSQEFVVHIFEDGNDYYQTFTLTPTLLY